MRSPFRLLAVSLFFALSWVSAQEPGTAAFEPHDAAVQALIRKLNAEDPVDRESAERDLLALGQPALAALKEAGNSKQPEVAARARKLVSRLTERAARPGRSYAEVLPASSIFLFEIADMRQFSRKFQETPLGKFWQTPAMRKYFAARRAEQVPEDRQIWECLSAIELLADGRAAVALASPESIEANELEPPLLYVLESKQPRALEEKVRALFAASGDPPRTTRRYGPFNIDEHLTSQTVFGQEAVMHALTPLGLESFLQNMLNRPAASLYTAMSEVRALLDSPLCLFHISSTGFEQLAEAGQLIDDEQIRHLESWGFGKSGTCQGALALNSDGIQERWAIKLGGAPNSGLLPVLKKMAESMPPPPAAGAPQALDLIPWQAGLLISLQGDVPRHAAELARALRLADSAGQPSAPQPKATTDVKPQKPAAQPNAAFGDPAEKEVEPAADRKPKTPAQQIMASDPARPAGDAPPAAPRAAASECPHIAHFEKIGLKLEQLLEQAQGPVQLALFFQQIGKEAPEEMPVSPLAAMVLKNPDVVRQSLDAAATGPLPAFRTEILNGGTHYIEVQGDPDRRPGFWLKGAYLAYSTDRDLLDLASLTCLHEKGTERIADRASYKQAVSAQRLDSSAVLTLFGDADQVLETPYRLSKLQWEDNPENPWPDYSVLKALLQFKPVSLQVRASNESLQIYAQTPFSLTGMLIAFRQPLRQAGL